MAEVYDCSDSTQLLAAARAARQTLGRGGLVVLPTDTVYGIAADAFTPEAVDALLMAKGRGRQSPPPVLIADTATLGALAAHVTDPVRAMADAFWPGPLTIVLDANPSLSWDLGDTGGTVALRIPNHPLTLELLRETGPLAVSSANKTGEAAANQISEAQQMLGEEVDIYLDAGVAAGDGVASTIVDATGLTAAGGTLRILREGGVSRAALSAVLPGVTVLGLNESAAETAPDAEPRQADLGAADVADAADAAPDAAADADAGAASTEA